MSNENPIRVIRELPVNEAPHHLLFLQRQIEKTVIHKNKILIVFRTVESAKTFYQEYFARLELDGKEKYPFVPIHDIMPFTTELTRVRIWLPILDHTWTVAKLHIGRGDDKACITYTFVR